MGNANEDLVKKGYDAFSKGDMDTLRSIMSADMEHKVPGNNKISGEYKGIDDVLGYYAKLGELTGGSFKVDLKSVKAKGDDHVISVHTGTAEREGRTIENEGTLDFTIKDGKMVRIEESNGDQAAEDAFWA